MQTWTTNRRSRRTICFNQSTDAKNRSVSNGDKVKVFNDRGSFNGVAKITDDVSPGIVVATLGIGDN